MFIFSLNNNFKWQTYYTSSNIRVSTGSSSTDLIDFGYQSALQFEVNSDSEVTASFMDNH